jgi:hypothetical protein
MSTRNTALEVKMSEFKTAFFIVPSRILALPNLTFAMLKIYETIFQFINHDKPCFLSNDMIKERTGVSSYSTINEAFAFFELHGELKRVYRNGQRYFIQPSRHIRVENDQPVDKGIAVPIPPYRCTDTPPIAVPIHNTKNLNSKNINKSFCEKDERKKNNEQKHDWVKPDNGTKQCAKFWGPGHPDFDRIHAKEKKLEEINK